MNLGEERNVALKPCINSALKPKHPTKRRVVVTGMGVETTIGRNPDEYYNNLLEGVSGITEITTFNCSNYTTVRRLFIITSSFQSHI